MAHPPRIPVWVGYEQTVVYFITFCVRNRHHVLANDNAFAAFIETTKQINGWNLIAAVLMPDHIHVLAAPIDRDAAVGALSAAIKRGIRRRLGQVMWEWQSGCFDRLLRSDESADEKWNYMRDNPVRAGLVKHWADWPYKIGFKL